jgi:hypothetical protein
MSFEEFVKITYHTRMSIRIPGSRTVIDKASLVNKKGKYNFEKEKELLRQVYENENFINK